MPLQILPRETNWGESLGGALGRGLGSGLQDLAQTKIKEYASRKAQAEKYNMYEQMFGPGWGKLAFLPEKMGMAALQGGFSPEQQMQAGQGMLPMQEQQFMPQQQQPTLQSLLGQQSPQGQGALEQLLSMQQPKQLSSYLGQSQPQMQMQQQQATTPTQQGALSVNNLASAIQRGSKTKGKGDEWKQQLAERQQEQKAAKDLKPWLTKEEAQTAQINDMASIADHALDLLNTIGEKNYPSALGRGIAEVSGGWLYPSMKEFYNTAGELALAKASSLKGQPTNFKIRLVQSIKPGLSADYKTNVRMLRRYKEVGEARGRRQAFRDNLKENGQFPTNIESIMSEYDNSMNQPNKHKKFFDKYPDAKDDAYFVSKDYEDNKVAEEDKKYGKSAKKASSEFKVGSVLDQLPAAGSVPANTEVTDTNTGKKYVSDGSSWRAA